MIVNMLVFGNKPGTSLTKIKKMICIKIHKEIILFLGILSITHDKEKLVTA